MTDDRFNAASHMVGAVFGLMGVTLLIVYASINRNPWQITAFSIYGFSFLSLFIASALHHGVKARASIQNFLRAADYYAIFLLIAGTLTPICLVLLRGPFGWSLFGVAWAVAITGIILKSFLSEGSKWITTTLYLALGWLGVLTVGPIYMLMGIPPLLFLGAGGLLYTIGATIFTVERPNPMPGRFGFHEIWHLFVIAAALTHYLFMYIYVLRFEG